MQATKQVEGRFNCAEIGSGVFVFPARLSHMNQNISDAVEFDYEDRHGYTSHKKIIPDKCTRDPYRPEGISLGIKLLLHGIDLDALCRRSFVVSKIHNMKPLIDIFCQRFVNEGDENVWETVVAVRMG